MDCPECDNGMLKVRKANGQWWWICANCPFKEYIGLDCPTNNEEDYDVELA